MLAIAPSSFRLEPNCRSTKLNKFNSFANPLMSLVAVGTLAPKSYKASERRVPHLTIWSTFVISEDMAVPFMPLLFEKGVGLAGDRVGMSVLAFRFVVVIRDKMGRMLLSGLEM